MILGQTMGTLQAGLLQSLPHFRDQSLPQSLPEVQPDVLRQSSSSCRPLLQVQTQHVILRLYVIAAMAFWLRDGDPASSRRHVAGACCWTKKHSEDALQGQSCAFACSITVVHWRPKSSLRSDTLLPLSS